MTCAKLLLALALTVSFMTDQTFAEAETDGAWNSLQGKIRRQLQRHRRRAELIQTRVNAHRAERTFSMVIVKPNPHVDYKIVHTFPDPDVDYNLTIVGPYRRMRHEFQPCRWYE